jgi:hypothetical protein
MGGFGYVVESPDPRFTIDVWDQNGTTFTVQMAYDYENEDEPPPLPNGAEEESFQWRSDAEEFVEKMVALLDKWGDTPPKEYEVAVSYEGRVEYTIKAQTEEEARELALEQFNGRAFRDTKSKVESVKEHAKEPAE